MRAITFRLGTDFVPSYVPDSVYAYETQFIVDDTGSPMPGKYRIVLHHYTLENQRAKTTVQALFEKLIETNDSAVSVVSNPRTHRIPLMLAGADKDKDPAGPSKVQYVLLQKDARGNWTAYAYANYALDLLEGLTMSRKAQADQDDIKKWSDWIKTETTVADRSLRSDRPLPNLQ